MGARVGVHRNLALLVDLSLRTSRFKSARSRLISSATPDLLAVPILDASGDELGIWKMGEQCFERKNNVALQ